MAYHILKSKNVFDGHLLGKDFLSELARSKLQIKKEKRLNPAKPKTILFFLYKSRNEISSVSNINPLLDVFILNSEQKSNKLFSSSGHLPDSLGAISCHHGGCQGVVIVRQQ